MEISLKEKDAHLAKLSADLNDITAESAAERVRTVKLLTDWQSIHSSHVAVVPRPQQHAVSRKTL